jgi:large subunit ribosomal protein L4
VATRQALTLAAQAKEIVTVADIATTGKTVEIIKFLAGHKVKEGDNVVIVVDTKNPELVRATGNIQGVKLVQATYLNVYTILNADTIIITNAAVIAIEEWLGAK